MFNLIVTSMVLSHHRSVNAKNVPHQQNTLTLKQINHPENIKYYLINLQFPY